MKGSMHKSAVVSACGTYRYRLARIWDESRHPLVYVMLNPSTADAENDDATIRRCIGFAKREQFGGIVVVNLFGLRATNPTDIWGHPDPVGPENDRWLRETFGQSNEIVVAWGAMGSTFGILKEKETRDKVVLAMMQEVAPRLVPRCLGMTKTGQPKHPVRLAGDTPFVPFTGGTK